MNPEGTQTRGKSVDLVAFIRDGKRRKNTPAAPKNIEDAIRYINADCLHHNTSTSPAQSCNQLSLSLFSAAQELNNAVDTLFEENVNFVSKCDELKSEDARPYGKQGEFEEDLNPDERITSGQQRSEEQFAGDVVSGTIKTIKARPWYKQIWDTDNSYDSSDDPG